MFSSTEWEICLFLLFSLFFGKFGDCAGQETTWVEGVYIWAPDAGDLCVTPEGSCMTFPFLSKNEELEVDEVRSTSWVTERTDAAASTKRSVSRKQDIKIG